MPARSKIEQLPAAVREELERRLISIGFQDYRQLSDWLAENGFEISKSAVHRFGTHFESRVKALKQITEQARAIVAENPDEDGAVNDALIRLAQERVFNLLYDLEVEISTGDMAKITKAVADLARAAVSQKKLAAEVRAKAASDAAERAGAAGKRAGLSPETIAAIQAEVLGIVE